MHIFLRNENDHQQEPRQLNDNSEHQVHGTQPRAESREADEVRAKSREKQRKRNCIRSTE